jgi:hypothetical protein
VKQNVTLYIDTNCFLQVRDLKDLPWRDLFARVERVVIRVAPVVVEELDRHKTSTRPRLRNRARAALKLIESASHEEAMQISLRSTGPAVILQVDAGAPIPWHHLPTLVRESPDDRLVATAWSAADTLRLQATRVGLLTADTGPRIRARGLGLAAYAVPDEWLLPDEPDDKDRKISELTRAVEALQRTWPDVVVAFGQSGRNEDRLTVQIAKLPPLPPTLQRELADYHLSRHPRHVVRSGGWPSIDIMNRPSEDAIEAYGRSYDSFERGVGAYFANLHRLIEARAATGFIDCRIENRGSVTAQGLILDLKAPTELEFYNREKDALLRAGSLEPPQAPEKPKSPFESMHNVGRYDVGDLLRPQQRDPTKFYVRTDDRDADLLVSRECAEFRPQRSKSLRFWFRAAEALPLEVELIAEASATNMDAPARARAILRIEHVELSWSDPQATQNLAPWIATRISDYHQSLTS